MSHYNCCDCENEPCECGCECSCHHSLSMPRLNEPAPVFDAITTHGNLRLADFEFFGFTEIYPELQKRNVDLLGLSVDSVYSHIAWVRNIEEKTGIKIPFPIIADLNKEVAYAYGMIMPGESSTEAVRCVFFIDPKGILRAMLYYPLTTGRNMQEILRMIDALQTSDEHKVATPVNWKPGDKVIVPAPKTQDSAETRMKEGYECVDWYLCKKSL
jgi:peroxiredoxin (alkyl hydroperoxide reductase subunit C)